MANKIKYLTLSSLDTDTLTGGFDLLSSASGLPGNVFHVKIINNSSKDLEISYDDVNANDFIKAGVTFVDTTNTVVNKDDGTYPSAYTKVSVKGSAGGSGTGTVYLAVKYLG